LNPVFLIEGITISTTRKQKQKQQDGRRRGWW
jgi:hypothetical protein